MSDPNTRLIKRFRIAVAVNHYYWAHLDGDDADGVRVDNLIKIAEIISGKEIDILDVDFEGQIIRSRLKRLADHAVIHVRKNQSENWKRFAVVKELCHTLCDVDDEWAADEEKALQELLGPEGLYLHSEQTPACQTEHIAEVMALELLYPKDFRDKDRKRIAEGESLVAIAEERRVPAVYLQRALSPSYGDACHELWEMCQGQKHPPIEEFDLSNCD